MVIWTGASCLLPALLRMSDLLGVLALLFFFESVLSLVLLFLKLLLYLESLFVFCIPIPTRMTSSLGPFFVIACGLYLLS